MCADLREFEPAHRFDLVIAVNSIQFLGTDAEDMLHKLLAAVTPGGVCGISIFSHGRTPTKGIALGHRVSRQSEVFERALAARAGGVDGLSPRLADAGSRPGVAVESPYQPAAGVRHADRSQCAGGWERSDTGIALEASSFQHLRRSAG